MEHVIQFGISLDDEAIKRTIISTAEKQIIERFHSDIKKTVFGNSSYDYALRQTVDRAVEKFLSDNGDRIVETAAALLVEKMARSKAVKEAIQKTIEENDPCQ